MNLMEAVRAAGVVGAGGAGFPTHIKMAAKAEHYIINAAECEPLIDTDKYIMRTYADEIVVAIEAVAAHLGATKKTIALKAKYKPEIAALQSAIERAKSDIALFEMPTFYPAGDEQVIVCLVTGKTVPERGLPLDVGAVVSNVGTAVNIYDALKGKPVTRKLLSVAGEVKEPVMLDVPVGTSIGECVRAAQPQLEDYSIIIGGPMMGRVYADKHVAEALSVTKTTGSILVLPKEHYLVSRATLPMGRIAAQTRSACIQCRMCTDMCPRYLTGHRIRPHLVMRNLFREHLIEDDVEYERAFGDAVNCCDCGICELFACPMGLSPRKVNIFAKGRLRERGIQVARNMTPTQRPALAYTKVPTDRLIARLGLGKYGSLHAHHCLTLEPDTVTIPLRQHIGAPAEPVRAVGDRVSAGDVLGELPEGKLSARIHASIDGVITAIDGETVVIRAAGDSMTRS